MANSGLIDSLGKTLRKYLSSMKCNRLKFLVTGLFPFVLLLLLDQCKDIKRLKASDLDLANNTCDLKNKNYPFNYNYNYKTVSKNCCWMP